MRSLMAPRRHPRLPASSNPPHGTAPIMLLDQAAALPESVEQINGEEGEKRLFDAQDAKLYVFHKKVRLVYGRYSNEHRGSQSGSWKGRCDGMMCSVVMLCRQDVVMHCVAHVVMHCVAHVVPTRCCDALCCTGGRAAQMARMWAR